MKLTTLLKMVLIPILYIIMEVIVSLIKNWNDKDIHITFFIGLVYGIIIGYSLTIIIPEEMNKTRKKDDTNKKTSR